MSMKILNEDESIRWACLFECLYNIDKKCKETNIDVEMVFNRRLKPHHIVEYIDNRFPILSNKIETGEYAGEFIHLLMYGEK